MSILPILSHSLREVLGFAYTLDDLLVLSCFSTLSANCINTRNRVRDIFLSTIEGTMLSPFNLEAVHVACNIPRSIGECQL